MANEKRVRQNNVFGTLGGTGLGVPTTYQATVLADAPTGYWRFNEAAGAASLADLGSGNHPFTNNGAVLGGAGALQDGSGATSAAFSGTAYMNTGVYAVSGTVYSVECWFKTSTVANMILLDQRYPNAFGEIELQLTASGFIEWLTWDSSYAYDLIGATNLADGQWHHVVATRNGTTATVYVDGVQVLQTTVGSGAIVAATTNQFVVGRDIRDGGRQFTGSLDEVAVYNGIALTLAQVQSHYNAGRGLASSTINFGTAPGFVTIDATKHAAITIDPDTATEEIVYLTSFVAGASTGTVLRGQEGTSIAAHPVNTPWVHGPTKRDNSAGRLAFARFAGGPYTVTTAWADVLTTADLVLPAQAGDVIEAGLNIAANAGATMALWADLVSIVGGVPVMSMSGDAAAPTGANLNGAAGWTIDGSGLYMPVVGSALRMVTAAEIVGGLLTLRLRAVVNASTRTLQASVTRPAHIWAKNHGPQEAA